MTRNFILTSILFSVFVMSYGNRRSEKIDLTTLSSKITFDRQTGGILSLTHKPSGQEFISPDVAMPLFSFTLSKPYEGESVEVSAKDFRKVDFIKTSPDSLGLIFFDHISMPLKVKVNVHFDADGLARMNFSVINKTNWAVKSIVFPQIASPTQLGRESYDDRLLFPFNRELLIEAPGSKNFNSGFLYPEMQGVQFTALYDSAAGLYLATYDANSHYKKYSILLEKDKPVIMGISHLLPEIPAQNITLPYDIVLGTFTGDWHDAADIYKRWAKNQPWCSRKISQRNDIPSFFKEGSAVLCIPFRYEKTQYKFQSFENVPKLPEIAVRYQKLTGMPHIGFALFGWENRGIWAGINYFPARPSNETWQKLNKKLKKQGNFTFMLPSGLQWVIKRKETGNGPAFDDTEDFEDRKGMVIQRADGKSFIMDKYNDKSSWRGLTTQLCHSSKVANETISNIYLDIARLGTSIVQFDQEHGGGQSNPCYSKTHEHQPGFTNQYCTDFCTMCQNILNQGKSINPEFGLSTESPSENMIPYMSTFWGRQCSEADAWSLGARSVGLFSYLYHEYIPVLGDGFSVGEGMKYTMGSAELRCYRLALTLARGLIPTVYMEQVPLEPETDWQKKVSPAFFSYCKPYPWFPEYLLHGVTLHPPKIKCPMQSVWHYQEDENGVELPNGKKAVKVNIDRPTIVGGSFEAEDGSVGTIIVNATSETQHARIELGSLDCPVTLFNAKRTKEQQWDKCPNEINISLEPYGVKVFIMSSK